LGFLLVAVTVGRRIMPVCFRVVAQLRSQGILLAASLILCFGFAYMAGLVGLAPIVGAFTAGLILEPVHYEHLAAQQGDITLEELIAPLVGFLVPIFFVTMGARVNVLDFARPDLFSFAACLTIAAILGKQYSQYEPLPGVKVNGELTMGENIADLGGLTIALDAYRASLKGKPAPVIDGLTGDQRVFLGWAQAWRGKLRDDAIRKQVVSDPHSPRQYRVNGPARNIDDWYTSFEVKPNEKLFVDPKERAHIW
jgi:hypothetical protein